MQRCMRLGVRCAPTNLALARTRAPVSRWRSGGGEPSFVLGAPGSRARTTVVLDPEPSLVLDGESL